MFCLLVSFPTDTVSWLVGVHRGDRINCETCYFCFDPAFVWPSFGRADFHST